MSTIDSFGPNQKIEILSTDMMKPSLLPVCRTDDEEPIKMETIEIDVAAGLRVFLPVIIPSSKLELSWEFTSHPKVSSYLSIFRCVVNLFKVFK